ncbi:amidophosphoribosyltransferase [Aquibaculum arenosum]|uniref:Amidophosphoribosyltransferase n=1 Tax=Aquibaculum arenosum TaxID=3032591 RepID=A0ABT5YI33_9PROT|nr:amidophosphoribosyltransferase [Fodinicurvata sp. CAU 1616]MDF2094568.1 amidophosphoribosyltransferase [Fodinicurvata sp. CAU 1616]
MPASRFTPEPQPGLPFDDDRVHEECAVFGIHGHPDAAAHAALGLHALQHRGQEASGIVTFDGQRFNAHRELGLVGDIFSSEAVMSRLVGHAAIGHNRYSTTGDTLLRNVQPLFADLSLGGFALAHNGNLTNATTLRRELVTRGAIFQSTSDTEVFIHLIATSAGSNLIDRMLGALALVEGAYSLVAMTDDAVIGVRDPLGVRPLVLGRLGDAWLFASETCAFDIMGAEFVRDVDPGEMVVLGQGEPRSIRVTSGNRQRFCVFEYIYFARPDSVIEGTSVYEARKAIGRELARESLPEADLVVPVPDSGVPAALGFAEESKLPFDLGIIRNHYVGRTFIEPGQEIRNLGVKLKHNANRPMLEGKRVVLVDDSIVRGTTSRKIVQMVRATGATEVHMRIASPPITDPCFYGVDTPERGQLLAAQMSVEEIARHLDVDSLAFISMDGLYRAMGRPGRDSGQPAFCDACFTGDYPTRLTDRENPNSPQLSLLSELKRA